MHGTHSEQLQFSARLGAKRIIMSDSVFKVYQGSYLTGFGMPTVIVSADSVIKPTLYSEYFVFIEGENPSFWGGQISIETNNAPANIINSEIECALDEAVLQAKTAISLRQTNHFISEKIALWSREKIKLVERDANLIAKLWSAGKFKNNLMAIKEKSKCQPLQDYIASLESTQFYRYSEFE